MNIRPVKKTIISFALAVLLIFSVSFVSLAQGASQASGAGGNNIGIWALLLDALIFGLAGICLLIAGYYIWEAITLSYSVKKELVEKQNQAVATVTASFILGMAIIIAAAMIVMK